jgi:hypothetical protein
LNGVPLDCKPKALSISDMPVLCNGVPRGGLEVQPPSPEIPKLGHIPRSVENKSVTT